MPALKLDMTIPLGDAGHVAFAADITDLELLSPGESQVLGDTAREFAEFAAAVIAPREPAGRPAMDGVKRDHGSLAGVDGGRAGGRA